MEDWKRGMSYLVQIVRTQDNIYTGRAQYRVKDCRISTLPGTSSKVLNLGGAINLVTPKPHAKGIFIDPRKALGIPRKDRVDEVYRVRCKECRWQGKTDGLLVANNPFDRSRLVYGCPHCRSIDCFAKLCDIEDCNEEATIGTPTRDGYATFSGDKYSNGYMTTCHAHVPAV